MVSQVVNIELPSGEMPLPEGANYVHFSWRGTDVQMLVGYIDLLKTVIPPNAPMGKPIKVTPEITHRFLLSVASFAMLKAQVDEIARIMKEAGVEFTPFVAKR